MFPEAGTTRSNSIAPPNRGSLADTAVDVDDALTVTLVSSLASVSPSVDGSHKSTNARTSSGTGSNRSAGTTG